MEERSSAVANRIQGRGEVCMRIHRLFTGARPQLSLKNTFHLPISLSISLLLSGCLLSPQEDKPLNGITQPKGEESFWLGETMTITWSSSELEDSDKVDIVLHNQDTSITVARDIPAISDGSTGSYDLFVYDSLVWDWDHESMNYTVAVENDSHGVRYESKNPVEVKYGMISPDGTRSYRVGDTLVVRWVWSWYLTYQDQALLSFSPNGGQSWHVIVPYGIEFGERYRGEFSWLIPETIEGVSTVCDSCLIKAEPYSGGGEYFNFSSNAFRVTE